MLPYRQAQRAGETGHTEMAERAREEVTANWDMASITGKLVDGYRALVAEKRATAATSISSATAQALHRPAQAD